MPLIRHFFRAWQLWHTNVFWTWCCVLIISSMIQSSFSSGLFPSRYRNSKLSWNPKFLPHIHNHPLLVAILSQVNSSYSCIFYISEIILILFFYLCIGLTICFFCFRLVIDHFVCILISSMRATWPTYLILLNLIIPNIWLADHSGRAV
jgi:hypothetical protein